MEKIYKANAGATFDGQKLPNCNYGYLFNFQVNGKIETEGKFLFMNGGNQTEMVNVNVGN